MLATKLESELLKVKKDLQGVKQVNDNFCKILDELNNIKARTISDPKAREKISEEFKDKAIIDIFASIESDFRDLRAQLSRQEIYKERVSDFVESLRIKKTFSFDASTQTILFLEEAIAELDADLISVKPEYVGTIDLGEVAIELGLCKTGTGIVVQKELLPQTLDLLIGKRMFRNIVFETSNAKITLKSSNQIVVESDNTNIRKIARIEIQ